MQKQGKNKRLRSIWMLTYNSDVKLQSIFYSFNYSNSGTLSITVNDDVYSNEQVSQCQSTWGQICLESLFFCEVVFNLSNSWHTCLCVNVCICKCPPPSLVLAHAISYSRDRKRNVNTWQPKCFVVVLGRTYNYSNECIQKQHIS